MQYNMLAWLQDEFMTLSSDRYVLPLKANFKGRMQGIIHDWSQTGETCYFEPMFLVEINNRLQELKREGARGRAQGAGPICAACCWPNCPGRVPPWNCY